MDYIFLLIIGVMILMIIYESLFPNVKLEKVKNWWTRVFGFNLLHLVISMVGYIIWEKIWGGKSLLHFNLSALPLGLLAYILNTWVFYWWHRARHEIYPFWLWLHQLHHSPKRIEVIVSFYKHPLEIISNSIIVMIFVYPILGLTTEANSWMSFFSAVSEFYYHSNIKTPHWTGYFLQRPEMHRLHHLQDIIRCKNYGDLPIWDILGGTFENPIEACKTGFSNNREDDIDEMICGKDVLHASKKFDFNKGRLAISLILLLGLLGTIGHVSNNTSLKGIAFTTVASPLPLVFSHYNSIETFSTKFDLNVTLNDDTNIIMKLDNNLYGKLKGPYNLRNAYGVIFSHGPFFDNRQSILLRQSVLRHGICNGGQLARDFGFDDHVKSIDISIRSKTRGNKNKMWKMGYVC